MPPGAVGLPPGATGLPPGATGLPPGATGLPPGATGLPPGASGMPPGGAGSGGDKNLRLQDMITSEFDRLVALAGEMDRRSQAGYVNCVLNFWLLFWYS